MSSSRCSLNTVEDTIGLVDIQDMEMMCIKVRPARKIGHVFPGGPVLIVERIFQLCL